MKPIKTNRLLISPASPTDLPALEQIDAECSRYFAFDPACDANHNPSLAECLTTGDIPPGMKEQDYRRENYHFCCLWQDSLLIGFLAYYTEYQGKDAVYLSLMYIRESQRGGGLGAELLNALMRRFAAERFRAVHLHCSLRNAMGLRFWIKNRFDRVVDLQCDGNLYPGHFAGIELARNLDENMKGSTRS